MNCQLARILPNDDVPQKFKNFLVWVLVMKPLHRRKRAYEVESGQCYLLSSAIKACLYKGDPANLLFLSLKYLELLPYSSDEAPQPWQDWVHKGGEQMPQEEATP